MKEQLKIKITSKPCDYIEYRDLNHNGAVEQKQTIKLHNSANPHPDLPNEMARLRPIIAKLLGYDYAESLIQADVKLSTEVREQLDALKTLRVDRITPIAVSISGSEEKKGVVISYMYKQVDGRTSCFNTPRIPLNQETLGIEEDLDEVVHDIEVELWAYQDGNKRSQLEIFDNDASESDAAPDSDD